MATRAQRKAQNIANEAARTGKKPTKKSASAKKPAATAAPVRRAIDPKAPPTLEALGERIVEAEFEAGAMQREQFPPPTYSEIAFAGRSNVGKSSLMNCLTGRRSLVRTSSTPGCTRQVSWFKTTSDDKSIIHLVDLPGYGYAKRSKSERVHWAGLIESFLLERPTLRGVVLLVDIRRGLEPDDMDLLEMLRSPARVSRPQLQVTLVATKMDKLSSTAQKSALLKITQQAGQKVVGFSSETGLGRPELWKMLRKIAGVGLSDEIPPVVPAAVTMDQGNVEDVSVERATSEPISVDAVSVEAVYPADRAL